MRIRHKVNVRIGVDTDMKNLMFAPDDDLAEAIIDSYTKCGSGILQIVKNTDEDVPLGDVDAVKGVFLRVDQDVVVTLNGGVETIQLRKAGGTGSQYARLFLEADINQINIAAPADADVNGIYCVWGDTA